MPKAPQLECHEGVVTGADDIVMVWTQEKLGGGLMTAPAVAIGLVHPNIPDHIVDRLNLPQQLAVGVVFFNHQAGSGVAGEDVSDIMVSVATANFDPRHYPQVEKILRYPFEFWKMRRITAEIEDGNKRSVSQAKLLGFKHEGTKRQAGPNGRDILVFGLLPDECPFWKRRSAA